MATVTRKRPRLESGDRLTRAEFHRRYELRPDLHLVELVQGVVYVASPTWYPHASHHAIIMGWLTAYWRHHPELKLAVTGSVFLEADSEVQPDACLWREAPGGPRVNEAQYIEGAPQLVVEVAVSSASYDLGVKLRAYERSGVGEYLVWLVETGELRWYRRGQEAFALVEPDAAGLIESAEFPGLRLPVASLLAGDLDAVCSAVE